MRRAVGAENVLPWVCVAPIAVLVALSWPAPGLRDERSFLPHSREQLTGASWVDGKDGSKGCLSLDMRRAIECGSRGEAALAHQAW